jgi:hypothetical protein
MTPYQCERVSEALSRAVETLAQLELDEAAEKVLLARVRRQALLTDQPIVSIIAHLEIEIRLRNDDVTAALEEATWD